jgi:hypothetical protein
MPILRSFIYLDERQIEDFVSEYEAGLLESTQVGLEQAKNKEGEGGFNVHVLTGGGKLSKTETMELLQVFKQNPAAHFQRLHDHLTEDHMLREVTTTLSASEWDAIQPKDLLEITAVMEQPAVGQVVDTFIEDLQGRARDDPEAIEEFRKFAKRRDSQRATSVPLLLTPAASPQYRFAARLKKNGAVERPAETISGEATVLVQLQRKLGPNERYVIDEALPLLLELCDASDLDELTIQLNDDDLRELLGNGTAVNCESLRRARIEPPGGVFDVLAIYSVTHSNTTDR